MQFFLEGAPPLSRPSGPAATIPELVESMAALLLDVRMGSSSPCVSFALLVGQTSASLGAGHFGGVSRGTLCTHPLSSILSTGV